MCSVYSTISLLCTFIHWYLVLAVLIFFSRTSLMKSQCTGNSTGVQFLLVPCYRSVPLQCYALYPDLWEIIGWSSQDSCQCSSLWSSIIDIVARKLQKNVLKCYTKKPCVIQDWSVPDEDNRCHQRRQIVVFGKVKKWSNQSWFFRKPYRVLKHGFRTLLEVKIIIV